MFYILALLSTAFYRLRQAAEREVLLFFTGLAALFRFHSLFLLLASFYRLVFCYADAGSPPPREPMRNVKREML